MDTRDNISSRFLIELMLTTIFFIFVLTNGAGSIVKAIIIGADSMNGYWKTTASLLGSIDQALSGGQTPIVTFADRKSCMRAAASKQQQAMKVLTDEFNATNAVAIQVKNDATRDAVSKFNNAVSKEIQIRKTAVDNANKIIDKTQRATALKKAYDAYNNSPVVRAALAMKAVDTRAANEVYNNAVGEQALQDLADAAKVIKDGYRDDIAACPK